MARIRNVNEGDRWSEMRIGFTRSAAVMYLAPKARRRRGSPKTRARPNLANLLMDKAMQAALDLQQGEVVRRLDDVVEGVVERMGGPA